MERPSKQPRTTEKEEEVVGSEEDDDQIVKEELEVVKLNEEYIKEPLLRDNIDQIFDFHVTTRYRPAKPNAQIFVRLLEGFQEEGLGWMLDREQ